MSMYIVKKGDTLFDVSRKCFGSSYKSSSIADLNQLQNPQILCEGQTLYLPTPNSSSSYEALLSQTDIYIVRYGDTLWKIADKMLGAPTRWPEIARLNQLKEPNQLLIGQPLKLPPNKLKINPQRLKKEQTAVKPLVEAVKYNQAPATAVPGNALFMVSDEVNPFRPKLVRKDRPGKVGMQPKDINSLASPGEHVMGEKSRFLSTSRYPFGASRYNGVRYFIDVDILKADGVKFYAAKEIELDLQRIEKEFSHDPEILKKVEKARIDYKMDKEVLVEGPIKPGALKTAPAMAITRATQVIQGIGIITSAYSLKQAANQSEIEHSIKPLRREVIQQAGGWAGATVGSWGAIWAGARAGGALGAAVSVETGPGVLLFGAVGAIVGGFVGAYGGGWVAGYVDEIEDESSLLAY